MSSVSEAASETPLPSNPIMSDRGMKGMMMGDRGPLYAGGRAGGQDEGFMGLKGMGQRLANLFTKDGWDDADKARRSLQTFSSVLGDGQIIDPEGLRKNNPEEYTTQLRNKMLRDLIGYRGLGG